MVHVFDPGLRDGTGRASPGLRPGTGHYLNLDAAIVRDVRRRSGWGALCYGRLDLSPEVRSALPALPFFLKGASWGAKRGADPRRGRAPEREGAGRSEKRTAERHWNEFHRRRLETLTRRAIRPGDVVIFPNLASRSMRGSVSAWLRVRSRDEAPAVVLLFMFPDYRGAGGGVDEQYAELFDALAAYPPRRRFLITETREMRDELAELAGGRLALEIAPHFKPEQALDALGEARRAPAPGRPPCVGFVGSARRDRGSHLVADIVESVAARAEAGLRFRVHVQNPAWELLDRARLTALPDLELCDRNLAPDAYYAFLAEIDIAVFPYEPGVRTALQGSGVFFEALALGQVPVVPSGSHLAEEARRLGGGFTTFDAWRPDAVADAVLEAVEDHAHLAERARAAGRRWREAHRLSRFLDRVTAAADAPCSSGPSDTRGVPSASPFAPGRP